MQKRGTSQIDWIVSLAIFLIFISWFFLFISPQINLSSNRDSSITMLKTRFWDEFSWTLDRTPIFITSNSTRKMQPIIIDWLVNKTDILFFDGTPFLLWDDKLIFLANISNGNSTYWIIEGSEYNQTYSRYGLDVEERQFSTKNLSVKFDEGMPESARYKNREKFDSGRYSINGVSFVPVNWTYSDYGFMAAYSSSTGNINHTTLLFKDNQEIWNYLDYNDENYTFTIWLDLDDYSSYYSNNLHFGGFPYGNESQALEYSGDYITLYGQDSFTMFFDNDANFNFTYYNESLELRIILNVTDRYNYRFVFHEGDFEDIDEKYYYARLGVKDTLEGIYLDNITSDYTRYKSRWAFQKEFYIQIYENSSAFAYLYEPSYEIGSYNPGSRNVFGETENLFALSEEGVYSPISVNYRIW